MNITEDYVSFEVAKLLKEKGFDDYNIRYGYNEYGKVCEPVIGWKEVDPFYLRPTHQMAMKWLREEKSIFIVIEPHAYDYVNEKNKSYSCSLWVGDNYYEYLESRAYPSYEETVEAALKYSLENLI